MFCIILYHTLKPGERIIFFCVGFTQLIMKMPSHGNDMNNFQCACTLYCACDAILKIRDNQESHARGIVDERNYI